MTKQVALSNAAYAALSREKAPGESFSDLTLRLLRESRIAKKDPMRWMARPHEFWLSMEEHLQMVEEGREADRRDPWDEENERQSRLRAQAELAKRKPAGSPS